MAAAYDFWLERAACNTTSTINFVVIIRAYTIYTIGYVGLVLQISLFELIRVVLLRRGQAMIPVKKEKKERKEEPVAQGGAAADGVGKTPTPKSTPRRKIVDFRLAHKMEDTRVIRDLLRNNGKLIQWQSEELTNVITLEALGLNSKVMSVVADFHCSETSVVKPPGINFLKAQARILYFKNVV